MRMVEFLTVLSGLKDGQAIGISYDDWYALWLSMSPDPRFGSSGQGFMALFVGATPIVWVPDAALSGSSYVVVSAGERDGMKVDLTLKKGE